MPLKFAKTGIKISQKIPSGRAKKATSVKISKSSGEKQSDDERLDMGTSPTDELSEAVMNEYGLTTRRPVLVGLFDFNPLFNHQLGPTAASRMFDLQIAATDLTMGQARRMHRIFGRSNRRRRNVYRKQMDRRFKQKMAEAADLITTLDNVHGLIRLIVDELDVKRNRSDIHGRLKVKITQGLANSREKKNPDIWKTITGPTGWTIKGWFERHGISKTFSKPMNNTTWLLQIAHEIRFLLLYGSPSWYSFDEQERTDQFFDYYEDIDAVEGDDSELSGNEILPIGGDTHPSALFKSMNPFKSKLWPSNPNDASWNAIITRLESFKDVIDGQDPGSEDYIGTLLGMLAKDLRAYRAIKDGDLDDALSDYGISKKALLREDSLDDSKKFLKNVIGYFNYGSDTTRILRSKKQHKQSLLKALYASKKNKHGMKVVDGFGLPFERIPIGGDIDNDTCRELFVNKAFKEGSFGDFSDFTEYVESFNDIMRDALGAAAAWDGWDAANDGFAKPHIRFDGAEAVYSLLDSVSDYVSESGFDQSGAFKFTDKHRKEAVRLALMQGANYSDTVKKDLIQHLVFRQYTLGTNVELGAAGGDILNSAETGDQGTVFGAGYSDAEDLTGNKYGARMAIDQDKHIGGTVYVNKTLYNTQKSQIKNANQDYYNSIVSLKNSATTYFLGRGSKDPFNTTAMTGEKIAGISAKDKGLTFGIVNKQYVLENKRQDSDDNVMVSASGMKTNPIAIALFPQGENATTIFDLPGQIVEDWIRAAGGGSVITSDNITSTSEWGILPPTKAMLRKYLNDTTPILDMNYWGLYAMACELLIEIVGEYFNFKVSFDNAYYERWALFKNEKKKTRKKSKVKALAASGEYKKIASVNYVDVAVQRSTVFAFRWYPDQMRGVYQGWRRQATRSQKKNKFRPKGDGDGQAIELAKHYHSIAGGIVQYSEFGDNDLKWAMEWFSALGNHMRGIKNEVKKVVGRKGAVGGLKNFFEDLNEKPEYGDLIRSLNEMQTHNRRHALSRMAAPSSKYAFMSSSEKVSSHKIRQILAMMTDPEFRQDGHDNGLENRRIMAVGLPSGTLDTLREIAYVESGEDDEAYQESSFIRLDIYKRDLRDDTRRFEPISFIFDMRMFTTDDETKLNLDFDDLASSGKGDNAVVFRAEQIETIEIDEVVPFFDEVLERGTKFVRYKTLYDSKNGKTRTTPFKGSRPVESQKYAIARTFAEDVRKDIVKNHAVNDFVKAYLKCMSGIDLYEDTFMINATEDDFSGIDTFTGSRALSSKKALVSRFGGMTVWPVAKDEEIEPMFENFLDYWKVKKRAERHPDAGSTKSLQKAVDTIARSRRFQAAKIKNRIVQPKIFERVFCIVFDPISEFEEVEPDHESETSARTARKSGMTKFLIESSRGLESKRDMRAIRRAIRKGDFSALEKFQSNCFDFYVTVSLLPSY